MSNQRKEMLSDRLADDLAAMTKERDELRKALIALLRDEPFDDDDPRLIASREKAAAVLAKNFS